MSTSHETGGSEADLGAGVWVEVKGEDLDLRDVTSLFSRASVSLSREGDDFFITAPGLEALTSDVEKLDRAAEIVQLINGAARLHWDNHQSLSPGHRVITVSEDGTRHESQVVRVGTIGSRARVGTLTVLLNGVVQPTPRPLPPQWVELALDDDDVAATLRILSDTDVTWSRLYHVFEIIETDASSQLDGWSTSAERNLFTHTANNRLALSDDARHGHEKWKPPAQPMTLDQARTLIRTIAIGWLTAKVS